MASIEIISIGVSQRPQLLKASSVPTIAAPVPDPPDAAGRPARCCARRFGPSAQALAAPPCHAGGYHRCPESSACHPAGHERLRGLMTIPVLEKDFNLQRETFHKMRDLFEQLKANTKFELDTLSMGMSNDYIAAIAEGATIVRIGTAIFGQRE